MATGAALFQRCELCRSEVAPCVSHVAPSKWLDYVNRPEKTIASIFWKTPHVGHLATPPLDHLPWTHHAQPGELWLVQKLPQGLWSPRRPGTPKQDLMRPWPIDQFIVDSRWLKMTQDWTNSQLHPPREVPPPEYKKKPKSPSSGRAPACSVWNWGSCHKKKFVWMALCSQTKSSAFSSADQICVDITWHNWVQTALNWWYWKHVRSQTVAWACSKKLSNCWFWRCSNSYAWLTHCWRTPRSSYFTSFVSGIQIIFVTSWSTVVSSITEPKSLGV